MKQIKKYSTEPDASMPGLDLLRSLAGYPHRSVHLARRLVRSRIVMIQRDQFGRVIGTTERLEESEYTDLDGEWLD